MAIKTEVVDRVPTYPGRVKMTPVSGQTNVYDMTRMDSPITVGTPINKALFDQKAYTLTDNVTVYVSASGSDVTGEGTSVAPYATIQKAVNSIPKCLGGYHAQIDIAAGTYEERVTIDGFYGGRLTIGVADRQVTVRGVSVLSSECVRLNITHMTHSAAFTGNLLFVDYGSNVTLLQPLTFRGENADISGIAVSRGGFVSSPVTVAFLDFAGPAINATSGAKIALAALNGNSNNTGYGVQCQAGALVTYSSRALVTTKGDYTGSGGRILTAGGTTMANASVV